MSECECKIVLELGIVGRERRSPREGAHERSMGEAARGDSSGDSGKLATDPRILLVHRGDAMHGPLHLLGLVQPGRCSPEARVRPRKE